MNKTDKLIEIICSIRYEDISAESLYKLRVSLVDTIGVTFAGAYDLREKVGKLLDQINDSSEVISPIGIEEKTSLSNAILINGLSSHFLELDDGVRYGVIHPSAPLFSALIPIAIVNDVNWEKFVLGAICGYETSIRLASAMQPSHYSLGYHPTATCCTVGVAVGIAIMLGFSKKEVKDSFSVATLSSYGTLKVLDDTSELKPYNCGKAALLGYYAAMMAKAGFCGPQDALSGDTGFLHMMCKEYDEDRLLGDADTLAVDKIYLKPYASCRHTHPEIEASFNIRKNEGFSIDKIVAINVCTYKGVIGKHDSNLIYGESSARMSIPYSIAVALYFGKAGIEEFTEQNIKMEILQNLTKMVKITGDEELSKLVPDKRVAIVEVVQSDGRIFKSKVDFPKGEPENPLSEDELFSKFSSMLSHAHISREKATYLFKKIMNEQLVDIKSLAL